MYNKREGGIMNFKNWLELNKNYTHKVSGDIASRLERAKINDINADSISLLEETPEFGELNNTVKSQLKKAIKLFLEFNRR